MVGEWVWEVMTELLVFGKRGRRGHGLILSANGTRCSCAALGLSANKFMVGLIRNFGLERAWSHATHIRRLNDMSKGSLLAVKPPLKLFFPVDECPAARPQARMVFRVVILNSSYAS